MYSCLLTDSIAYETRGEGRRELGRVCDIPWDEAALMDQFRQGLQNDVKDLLLTFPEDPMSLTEAISRSVRCDNRLSSDVLSANKCCAANLSRLMLP